MTTYRNAPIPCTGKRKRYNPELRAWRGRSYRKGGKRVRALRAALEVGEG